MLMIQPKGIRRIPLDKVMPYNEDDLLFFLSHDSAMVINKIQNERGERFSIKELIEKNEVFACNDFYEKVSEFKDKFFKARLERFFVTKKVDYLFFDAEEQDFLQKVFEENHLEAFVELQVREPSGEFKKKTIVENLTEKSYDEYFGKELIKLKIPVFVGMSTKMRFSIERKVKQEGKRKNRFNLWEKIKEAEMRRLDEVFEEFPELRARTKQEFKDIFRALSKKYHPDMNGGDDEIFKSLNEGTETLKKSSWYKNLPDGEGFK